MDNPQSSQIPQVKEEIINLALIIGSIAGAITYFLSLTRLMTDGFESSFVTDFLAIGFVVIATIYRKKLSLKFKTYVILIGLLLVILVDVYELGILSANKVLLVFIPFLALFAFTPRRSFLYFGLSLACISFLGYLHVTGYVEPEPGNLASPIAWLINYILIGMVAVVMLFTVQRFNSSYEKLINKLMTSNDKIKSSERSYTEIFNATVDAIIILDQKKLIDYNRSLLEIFEWGESQEIDYENTFFLNNDSDRDVFEGYLKNAQDGIPVRFDWLITTGTQKEKWVEISLKKVVISGAPRIMCIIRDIDEQKRTSLELEQYKTHLEKLVEKRTETLSRQKNELKEALDKLQNTQNRLLQSEKMASLGLLASGIAHEINNPLNFIKGGIHGIELYLKENEGQKHLKEVEELMNGINNGVERAAKIVTSLSLYGREKDQFTDHVNIHDVIDNCLTMLKNELREGIQLKKTYTNSLYPVRGDVGKLHQVFLNILTNAIQAIKGSGEIEIKSTVNPDYITVNISDSGVGIPRKNLNKLSDPFFTTKDVGEGTGLGLYIVFNIIEEHNGKISFVSEEGKGTNVNISLPLN